MSMTHEDVAAAFSRGATRGKGCNMFIDGDTIYSYGYHFAIAKRIDGGYLMNKDDYSVSTSSHQAIVRDALWGRNAWYVSDCDPKRAWDDCIHTIERSAKKIPRARERLSDYINECVEAIRTYLIMKEKFNLKDRITANKITKHFSSKAWKRIRVDAFVGGNRNARKLFVFHLLSKKTKKQRLFYDVFGRPQQ